MNPSRKSVAILVAALLAVPALAPPCPAGPILDWLCGKAPNMTSQTMYVPPYVEGAPPVGPPVVTVPASPVAACGGCAPSCGSSAPACGGCAPQVCQYTPYAAYRTVYQPVQGIVYQPSLGSYPPVGCAVAAYRPVLAWVEQPRLVQYTTYRVMYPAVPVVAYSPACAACPSPCAACPSPCAGYGCGVPSTGCNSCAPPPAASLPSTSYPSAPLPALPETSAPSAATPLPTFENPSAASPTTSAAPVTQPGNAGNGAAPPAPSGAYQPRPPVRVEPEAPKSGSKTSTEGYPRLIFPQPDAKNSSLPAPKRSVSNDRLTAVPRPGIIHQAAMPISQDASGWVPLQE
jgi:hypothetical protein